MSRFSNNLIKILAMNSVSQRGLSKIVCVKQQTVNAWCLAKTEPSIENIGQICVALQCEPNDLLGDYLEGWTENVLSSYILPTP